MKITYTTSEAKTVLTKIAAVAFSDGCLVTVEIVPDRSDVHSLEAYALMVVKFGDVRFFSKKLDAIRYLRELLPIGLADAKYVVEAASDNVLRYYVVKKTLDGFAIHEGM